MTAYPAAPQGLNNDQLLVAQDILSFLVSDEKYFSISGPGGTGKTFLLSHLVDTLQSNLNAYADLFNKPRVYFEIALTATTNKAADVLSTAVNRRTQTIHSFLNLKVRENYETGETKISPTKSWKVHSKKLIFIDEASMVDRALLNYLEQGTDSSCKIIFLGDHCQLAPVTEKLPPVYNLPIKTGKLITPVRNAGQPALLALCTQLRETVETGIFKPIEEVPGVIDYLTDDKAEAHIVANYGVETPDERLLSYTNNSVRNYNTAIRGMRQLPEYFTDGEILVNNTACEPAPGILLPTDLTVTVRTPSNPDERHNLQLPDGSDLEVRQLFIKPASYFAKNISEFQVHAPVDLNHFNELSRYYARENNWNCYFFLKNSCPDLRQRDALTVHKAQGATFETIYLDLEDIGSCRQPDQVARLLYVGVSRARSRVFLRGRLPAKYS